MKTTTTITDKLTVLTGLVDNTLSHIGEDLTRQRDTRFRLPPGSVLGTFGKGIEGSVSLNFGLSGGANCDTACRHHPQSTAKDATFGCYAVRAEIRPDRTQLRAKLARHESFHAEYVATMAIRELQALHSKGKTITWLRISTNGSVPQPENAKPGFLRAFRSLLAYCHAMEIPVHFPVETAKKAQFYRRHVGHLVAVRESANSKRRWRDAVRAISVTAAKIDGLLNRITAAREEARQRRERTGRRTIVCPAVVNSFRAKLHIAEKNPKALCGSCTACANPELDIVYPHH